MNFGRKMMKTVVAAVAAIATLGAGGVDASAACAGGGVTKAQAALDQARTECETGFLQRHPGEGDGDYRVVAVGAVPYI